MSFVFYDTETTGLKPEFDQIVQLAAIKTDHNLNIVDTFQASSRLDPHINPSPPALCVNGLGIADLLDPAKPSHYIMACQINDKFLSWSPSIFAGFNSLRFDEEMLRHMLYQTLHKPYLTSGRDCGRLDIMNLVMAASINEPDALVIPEAEGKKRFTLELLSQANGINHTPHDALSDANAQLELARLVRDRAAEAWSGALRFSKKFNVDDFVRGEQAFLLTTFYQNEPRHAPVTCIGQAKGQVTALLCLSLVDCPSTLAQATDAELQALLTESPHLIRLVRTNKIPTLTPFFEVDEALFDGDTLDQLEEFGASIKEDTALCQRLIEAHATVQKAWPESPLHERQLYANFFSNSDEQLMAQFHAQPWERRIPIVDRFTDTRLRCFGLRLLYLHARHLMPSGLLAEAQHDLANRLCADGSGALTASQAMAEVSKLLAATPSARDLHILGNYQAHLNDQLPL